MYNHVFEKSHSLLRKTREALDTAKFLGLLRRYEDARKNSRIEAEKKNSTEGEKKNYSYTEGEKKKTQRLFLQLY